MTNSNPVLKRIVPNLISFDTKLNKINGFYFSENFNYYSSAIKKSPFHYNIIIDDSIEIPEKYDFRCGYYKRVNNCWYYSRKIIGNLCFKFKYDIGSNSFYFNSLYSLLPFKLGGIDPVGKLIGDIINLNLFLKGIFVFFGNAIQYKSSNICLIAPSFNGKTTLVEKIVNKGGSLISGDILIINFDLNTVFPTPHRRDNGGRDSNIKLSKTLVQKKSTIIDSSVNVDEFYLLVNHTGKNNSKSKTIKDFIILNSLFFLNSTIGKSMIFDSGLSDDIFSTISDVSKRIINYKFFSIDNFNTDELLK